MDPSEIWYNNVDYSSVSDQSPVACSCDHGNDASCSIKDWKFIEWLISFSKKTLLHEID
jgi:hypothetical protein